MKRSEDLQDYLKIYKNGLLDDTLPFWINNCIDQKYGGFTFCLGDSMFCFSFLVIPSLSLSDLLVF